MVSVIAERWQEFESKTLETGSHNGPDDGFCVMEAAAYVAGEPFSDHPECVSPVLGAFLRRWNDDLDDAGRQKLKPYIPRVLNTAGSVEAEELRAWLVTDWLVRVHTPAWLQLAGLTTQAEALRQLPPILSSALAREAQPTINGARKDAAAAWDAAWDAAGAAAWAAARAAAWAAAGDAAGAAAWAAARAAAGDAAGAAADQKLTPTVEILQASAFQLLDQLIAGAPCPAERAR